MDSFVKPLKDHTKMFNLDSWGITNGYILRYKENFIKTELNGL